METRNQVIERKVVQYLRATGFSWPTFGQNVIEHYTRHVPAHQRHVPVSDHVDPATRMENNGQTVERYVRQSVKHGIPVELEDSIIAALPEPYRRELMVELCARWGVLPAVIPNGSLTTVDLVAVGAFMKDAGEVIAPLTQALADAKFSAEDIPALEQASRELQQHMAGGASLHHRLDQVLEQLRTSNVSTLRR